VGDGLRSECCRQANIPQFLSKETCLRPLAAAGFETIAATLSFQSKGVLVSDNGFTSASGPQWFLSTGVKPGKNARQCRDIEEYG
jgi:hypothetical protein